MRIATLASLAALSLAVAASPATIVGLDMAALAKDGGNGGGNGGGGGNGNGGGHGGGNGNGGSHNSGSDHGNSKSQSVRGKSSEAPGKSKSDKTDTATSKKEKNLSAQMAGLNSLKRNYRALMHTSDPRMAAISAYAVAYAQYEIDNGIEPAADDPVLGDQALEDALASATKTGEVSPAALNKAKTILGVGDADGKIDQIRTSLENAASTTSDE